MIRSVLFAATRRRSPSQSITNNFVESQRMPFPPFPFEHEIASIDSAKLIPLGELPDRLNELDRERLTIVHCHSGQRSAQAVRLLREAGFANVFNLEGGIATWSDEIDSDVPQY